MALAAIDANFSEDNLDALNHRLRRQSDVLIQLAKTYIHSKDSLLPGIREMNEASAYTLGSDRTSVWFYNEKRSAIRCVDLFERELGLHSQGKEISITQYPSLFVGFEKQRSIAIEDCQHDPRSKDILESYLLPLGIRSILNSAIWVDGQVAGLVCHAQTRFARRWTLDERNFITSVANTVAHWMDIAGRKEAEDALRGMQFSIDCAGDAILWVTPDARLHYVNEAACRLLCFSKEELLGMRFFEIAPRLTADRWPEKWEFVKGSGSLRYESTLKTKHGKLVPVEVSLNYLQFQGQEFQCAFVRNITERKAAQQQIEKQKEFFRKVIDMNPNFIFAKDRGGRFVLVNQAVADAYGTTVPDLIGRTDADFSPNAEEIEHFRNDDVAVMDERREKFIPEERITDAKGRTRYLQTVKRPIIEDDGTVQRVLGVSTDITDRKAAEEEQRLLELQMQHTQKLESLGVLAGGIAHDFNNLLMGVIGNAALAAAELPKDSPVLRRVAQISIASKRAAGLTNQLLAYSGRGRFVIEPADLTKLVTEMGTLLESSISKKADLEYEVKEGLGLVEADSSQLRQVVMNLITNASDALGERGGKILVRTDNIEATESELSEMYLNDELPPGRYITLEVTDNGCGMDQETLRRIFDPFFTTKFTGRGLGLAAVLGIVRSHGGALRVRSELGVGTSFSVLFPMSAKMAAMAQRDKLAPEAKLSRSGTFLVVDDEETSRSVSRDILEHLGYQVVVAQDGLEAVELFRDHCSSLVGVLLDLTMPRMDGEETWTEITQIRSDVPVLLTSGYSELEAASRFRDKNIAGFIQKPFHPEELRAKLSSLVFNKT